MNHDPGLLSAAFAVLAGVPINACSPRILAGYCRRGGTA